jgi:hypothetical protein
MKTFVLTVLLAVALAACGSGGEAVKTAGGGSTTTSTVGLPKDPNEKALLESATLKLSDLPAGFVAKSRRDTANGSLEATLEKIPECAQLKELAEGKGTGEARSPHFEYGKDVDVSNDVEIFRTTAERDAVMAVITAPGTVTCLQKTLEMGANKGLSKNPDSTVQVNGVSVKGGPIQVGSFGEGSVGIGFVVAIDIGRTVNLYFDLVGVKVGRTLTTYMFQDSDAHALGSLKARIIQTTVNRMIGA